MRKSGSAFKIPSNSKTIFHELTKSQVDGPSYRPSQESSDRRKQSLPLSSKNQFGLMAQIKQALKNKECIAPQKIDQRLNEAKRIMYEDMDPSHKYSKKQNRAYNAEERETTFKDNLKQMQSEISSLKKLMEYQKARNHKIFEEKLFTVQQKFQQHRQIDDKIQFLRDLVQQSNRTIVKERKNYFQQLEKHKYLKRQEMISVKQDLDCLKANYVTMEDVDQRIAENLQIFKTFLVQNIDKNVLHTIDNKTVSLAKAFEQMAQQVKQQQIYFKQSIQKSHRQLFGQIQSLRDECQSIAESVAKEEIIKLQTNIEQITSQLNSRIQQQASKLREEWVESMDEYQRRISQVSDDVPNISALIDTRINPIKEEIEEFGGLLNDTMSVVKNLIKKVDSVKAVGVVQNVVNVIKQNVRDIQWLKEQVSELTEQLKYIEGRIEPSTKCVQSNIVTSACLQKSRQVLLIEDSFER